MGFANVSEKCVIFSNMISIESKWLLSLFSGPRIKSGATATPIAGAGKIAKQLGIISMVATKAPMMPMPASMPKLWIMPTSAATEDRKPKAVVVVVSKHGMVMCWTVLATAKFLNFLSLSFLNSSLNLETICTASAMLITRSRTIIELLTISRGWSMRTKNPKAQMVAAPVAKKGSITPRLFLKDKNKSNAINMTTKGTNLSCSALSIDTVASWIIGGPVK